MRFTWIVVADSARARILGTARPHSKLVELHTMAHSESRAKARDLVADGRSAGFNSVGSLRHTIGDDKAPQQYEHQVFARQIARKLAQAHFENQYDRLVLMAPPQFLGLIRHELDDVTMKLVVQTVAKDLTALKDEQIREQLESVALSSF